MPDKAGLGRFLKAFVDPVEQTPCTSLVGWLLHNAKWEANITRKGIAESYLQFVKSMGSRCLHITVVFDGYNSTI